MKCSRNLWLYIVAGMQILRAPTGVSAADSPCPDVFRYDGSPGNEYGIITVPSPYPYIAIAISVDIYVTGPLPRESHIKLQPVDKDVSSRLTAGSRDPILYRLDFPVTSPLPTIKTITVNQHDICRGTEPDSSYLTTITVQHAVFNEECTSASLECPGSSPPSSPCPDVFRYERDGSGDWHGIISVPNPYPVVAILIKVEMYVAASSSSGNETFGLLNSRNDEEWEKMRTGERYFVQYRLDFPLRFPLPTVKSIVVNNRQICSGSSPSTLPLSTLSYQHGLFSKKCPSASLDCPDNIVVSHLPNRDERTDPTPQTRTPPSVTDSECGLPAVRTNALVVGGWVTRGGIWPWHVALYQYKGYNTVYNCGGSLVGTRTIITAAHCFFNLATAERIPDENFIVSLGRYNLSDHKEEGTQNIDVSRVFVHPEFNFSIMKADVAIVILRRTVQITTQVRPACLWSSTDTGLESVVGKDGLVAGWGLNEDGIFPDKLKMVNMKVVKQLTCIFSHPNFFKTFAHETTFCAGFRNGSTVCNGDSGGGLMFQDGWRGGRGVWRLRGVVSNSKEDDFVSGRCDINNYVLFTDIAPYLSWIETLLL